VLGFFVPNGKLKKKCAKFLVQDIKGEKTAFAKMQSHFPAKLHANSQKKQVCNVMIIK